LYTEKSLSIASISKYSAGKTARTASNTLVRVYMLSRKIIGEKRRFSSAYRRVKRLRMRTALQQYEDDCEEIAGENKRQFHQ